MNIIPVVAAWLSLVAVSPVNPHRLPDDEATFVLASVDDTLGMALMSAVVGGDGSLVRGSGADGSSKTAGGTYTVLFDRDVTACTYVAVLGDTGNALPPVGNAVVSRSGSDSRTVFVETLNQAGSLADAPFHLIVFCAQ